eukprot:TRINITY_DN79120_c0_g1_i1.p1 TRINITY_DN79120_c0_g1~~TRINITY_DN79120_c0_g1_i1.p1  ORF type:complete len:145 (+),score=33.78 TRINITY_DN79120_c0_g1_i1:58-435(+)
MNGPGLTTSQSMPSMSMMSSSGGRGPPPVYRIPACYSSHKALSKTFIQNPELFSGQGMRLGGEMEKYRTAEMKNQGQNAKAYLRRQIILPEVDGLRKSFSNDIWKGGRAPKFAGEKLEVIHKDTR